MEEIKKIFKILDKIFIPLFLICFFLIKIPPFYLFFPLKTSLLTTHTLARGIVLILFISILFNAFFQKKYFADAKQKTLAVLYLFFLFFHSLSVIPAISIVSFLQRYKDVVFPGLFLFAALKAGNVKKGIIYVLLASLLFNFFYQMFIFASPSQFVSWAKEFVYSGHFELVNINLNRARIFIETYDEIALPFVFLFFIKEKKSKRKVLYLILFAMIALPSLLSNFRSRVLMLGLSFLASLMFLTKQKLTTSLFLVASIVVLGLFSVTLLNRTFGFSFVDRFALEDKVEDIGTVELRGSNIKTTVEMGTSYPLFGVGLGNYYDYLSPAKKTTASIVDWVNRESRIASTNPHNIFAQILSETGLISLIFYTGMLGYFGYEDLKTLTGKDFVKRAFVLAFWTLFSYSLFNPTTTLTYNSVFWILRAMLI